MPRVLTNNSGLAYSIEASLGVAGATWNLLEPNEISQFGAEITTVSRDPISKTRQRRKGTVTDVNSGVGFVEDLTLSSFRHFIEGFVFATAINRDVTDIPVTAVVGAGTDAYTVAALTAAQAAKLNVGTLLWATGLGLSANNGLKQVDANIATSAVSVSVTDPDIAPEAALAVPTGARISLAGYRIPTSGNVTWTWAATAKQATLALTAIGTNLAASGLTLGQTVHIGSVASLGADVINGFENGAANDMVGYARVVSIATGSVVFDKVSEALQATDSTAPSTAVDILFGEFIRNRAVDHADYLERSFHFELASPGLGRTSAGVAEDRFEYSKGNYCNTVGFGLPLTDKAVATFAFIGTDTDSPVAPSSRLSGASTARNPPQRAAFNTSADIARLRITEADEDGLTTDFKSLVLNLNNNVSPEKAVGTVGAKYVNFGNFFVNLETQLIFTNDAVIQKIRDNETVTMDFVIRNSDGVIAVDIPSMILGGGGREFPRGESVLINLTCEANDDNPFDSSIGVSIIPVPLP